MHNDKKHHVQLFSENALVLGVDYTLLSHIPMYPEC